MKDHTGQKFGRLYVIERTQPIQYPNCRKTAYLCQCDCGQIVTVRGDYLRIGKTKSCGCLFQKHSHWLNGKATTTYKIWDGIIQRCTNPNNRNYRLYGGRGIKVCKRWLKFENFLNDMGQRPQGLSIDRKNVNGNYEPINCRWATPQQQSQNTRTKEQILLDNIMYFTNLTAGNHYAVTM